MGIDNRSEERVHIAIDFNLEGDELDEGAAGCTRDISESGIYFVSNVELTIGNLFGFGIEYETPAGWKVLKGVGRILRIDYFGDQAGGAARIIGTQFDDAVENIYLSNKGKVPEREGTGKAGWVEL
jgi:hypothetical protein